MIKIVHDSTKLQILLLSIYAFVLELAVLRLTPSYVRYLGYFNNFILLAIFFGFGLGFLLVKSKINYSKFHFLLLFIYFGAIFSSKAEVQIVDGDMIFFQSNKGPIPLPPFLLLPLFFILITFLFITAVQKLGRYFSQLPSLVAYRVNIIGSLLGIIIFSSLSFLSLSPIFWFSISGGFWLISALLVNQKQRTLILLDFFYVIISILFVGIYTSGSTWSPYQRIDIRSTKSGYLLRVNDISHQMISKVEDNLSSFYQLPYTYLQKEFKRALIIGSGGGNDVSIALYNKVNQVTAIEIDPQILLFGKKLHPSKPYEQINVTSIVEDGRNILKRMPKQSYDLVVYALPDSLALSSGFSNLRLEGYLFTKEAFIDVKNLLTQDGVFVLYNDYRNKWLVDRIASMLKNTFDSEPVVFVHAGKRYYNGVYLIGPGVNNRPDLVSLFDLVRYTPERDKIIPTDNWPFLYLKQPSIPPVYLGALAVILLSSLILAYIYIWRQTSFIFPLSFFFFGASFMLLETRSLSNFLLLFGSTWIVNSLVFFAILLSIYLAIIVVDKNKVININIFWLLLFLSLSLNVFYSEQLLLTPNIVIRYISASLFFFSPIFFANILFSYYLKFEKKSYLALGSNLIGSMFGGVLEYTSLIFGYKFLIILALLIYLLALLTKKFVVVQNFRIIQTVR